MNIEPAAFSEEFCRLYCDPAIFDKFSAVHPISFDRVLPFSPRQSVMDDPRLLAAEAALLAGSSEATRLAVIEALGGCGLISPGDVASLKQAIDYFDADFFELMGEVYATAGMFACALRWHREIVAELESRQPQRASDLESVYASVGYCLYSLGFYPEAIAWSKSCIGPRQTADTLNRLLINYEAEGQGGCIQGIARAGNRVRYTVSALNPAIANGVTERVKTALESMAPFQEVYIDWIGAGAASLEIQPDGYPFQAEYDATCLTRHRLNLLFSLCAQADEFTSRGFVAEAKRLLFEALLLEPNAEFVSEKIACLA